MFEHALCARHYDSSTALDGITKHELLLLSAVRWYIVLLYFAVPSHLSFPRAEHQCESNLVLTPRLSVKSYAATHREFGGEVHLHEWRSEMFSLSILQGRQQL